MSSDSQGCSAACAPGRDREHAGPLGSGPEAVCVLHPDGSPGECADYRQYHTTIPANASVPSLEALELDRPDVYTRGMGPTAPSPRELRPQPRWIAAE